MKDYTIYYKSQLDYDTDWADAIPADVFISGFNSTDRIRTVFDKIRGPTKYWIIFPEYGYTNEEYPTDADVITPVGADEAEFIHNLFAQLRHDVREVRLCVDISGFIPPYLMFLLRYLSSLGVKQFEAIYAEPARYLRQEETVFTEDSLSTIRQVAGLEGNHSTNSTNDLLIIGSGYDHQLIAKVAEHKNNAQKIQLLGFPSLRADMYQENVLRAGLAADAVGGGSSRHVRTYFAPANDPFVTASVLQQIVHEFGQHRPLTNLYLCPIATKPQTLGCALYYLSEWTGKPGSIIFPFCTKYTRQADAGIGRIWRYTVELPTLT